MKFLTNYNFRDKHPNKWIIDKNFVVNKVGKDQEKPWAEVSNYNKDIPEPYITGLDNIGEGSLK